MPQSTQTDQIITMLSKIDAKVNSSRLFDVLEVMRDQVYDLKQQNQQIRNDVMELQRVILQNANKNPD